MQVCISLQTNNHATTPSLSFLQARYPSCHPTNSIKALKALIILIIIIINRFIQRHKVITVEMQVPGSMLVSRGRRESPGKEECL